MRTSDCLALAARDAVLSMVRGQVDVSVNADCVLINEERSKSLSQHSQTIGTIVLVELIGPADDSGNQRVLAKADAGAWCADEVVSAARRAADHGPLPVLASIGVGRRGKRRSCAIVASSAQVALRAFAQASATLPFAVPLPGSVAQPDFTRYSCCS
jgi:hypothetical protein